MWPDRVSNPGPLTYESGALTTALRGPASESNIFQSMQKKTKIVLNRIFIASAGSYLYVGRCHQVSLSNRF